MRNKRTLQRGLSLLLAGGMALSSVGVTPVLAEEYSHLLNNLSPHKKAIARTGYGFFCENHGNSSMDGYLGRSADDCTRLVYALTPQTSTCVSAGKGDGSSAFFSSFIIRLVITAPCRSKHCGSAVLVSGKMRVVPSERVNWALSHQASWGKSARVVSTSRSARTGRPNSNVQQALGSRLMPQLW